MTDQISAEQMEKRLRELAELAEEMLKPWPQGIQLQCSRGFLLQFLRRAAQIGRSAHQEDAAAKLPASAMLGSLELCGITFRDELVEEGKPWEVAAEPEPQYFETLTDAVRFYAGLTPLPPASSAPMEERLREFENVLTVLKSSPRDGFRQWREAVDYIEKCLAAAEIGQQEVLLKKQNEGVAAGSDVRPRHQALSNNFCQKHCQVLENSGGPCQLCELHELKSKLGVAEDWSFSSRESDLPEKSEDVSDHFMKSSDRVRLEFIYQALRRIEEKMETEE